MIRFLPTTNLFRRNPYLNDHVTGGDAGLYDLLLHSCDRAFTVPQIGKMAPPPACGSWPSSSRCATSPRPT